jgi:hypothetical protein
LNQATKSTFTNPIELVAANAAPLLGSLAGSDPVAASFEGISYDLSKAGAYDTLDLISSNGSYRSPPKSDWSLKAPSASGTDSFILTISVAPAHRGRARAAIDRRNSAMLRLLKRHLGIHLSSLGRSLITQAPTLVPPPHQTPPPQSTSPPIPQPAEPQPELNPDR